VDLDPLEIKIYIMIIKYWYYSLLEFFGLGVIIKWYYSTYTVKEDSLFGEPILLKKREEVIDEFLDSVTFYYYYLPRKKGN